jgi:hypothetical protein
VADKPSQQGVVTAEQERAMVPHPGNFAPDRGMGTTLYETRIVDGLRVRGKSNGKANRHEVRRNKAKPLSSCGPTRRPHGPWVCSRHGLPPDQWWRQGSGLPRRELQHPIPDTHH